MRGIVWSLAIYMATAGRAKSVSGDGKLVWSCGTRGALSARGVLSIDVIESVQYKYSILHSTLL